MTYSSACSTCLGVAFLHPPPHELRDSVVCPNCQRVIPLRQPRRTDQFSATDGMSPPELVPKTRRERDGVSRG